MICPTEFMLAQYVDGELPEGDAMELRAHSEACAICRERIAALRDENQLLTQSLQGIEWWEPELELVRRKIPAFVKIGCQAAVLIGLAILIRTGYGLIASLQSPEQLDWLYPFSLSGQLNWLANGFFYLIGEGGSIMTSLVNEIGFALLSLLILGFLFTVTRRMIGTTAVIGILALMVVFVLPGYAIDIRRGDQAPRNVTVAPSETIDDTLIVFGDSVNVRGTVTGDLIAFARQVNVQGTIQGNVVSFGQRINIPGNVNGDIFGFGQSVEADGHVGRNLWGFGQTLAIGTEGRLEHDATLFGADINMDGDIGGDLTAFGAFLGIGGNVGRDVRFRGDRLSIHAPSKIGRNLDARVRAEKNVQIDSEVTIAGKKKIDVQAPQQSKYLRPGFYVSQVLRIGAAFIMGLLLFWIFPSVSRVPLLSGRILLTSGGIGFLAAVATPVAAIILLITLIGLPIALVALALWLLGLYLAKIVVARCIGGAILGASGDGMASTAKALLLGLIVVIVAINLPFIGGVLNILLMLIGLGALVLTAYRMWGLRRSPEGAVA